jgi:hypothetical protein
MYSWAKIAIYQSGKVRLNTYGFDETMTSAISTLDKNIVLH